MSMESYDTTAPSQGGLSAVMERIGWTRAHWAVVIMVLAGMFFDALEQDTTGAITEGLKASFGMDTSDLAFLNTVMIIGGLVGRLGTGYLADRKGRRYALSFNLLLYTLGGLLSAAAPNQFLLEVSRFIVGIGLGGEFTVGLALVAEMVSTKYRGTVAASLNIGSGGVGNFVAFGLFLVVLGPLNDMLGGTSMSWRWLYVLLAVPALLVVLIRRYMPESPRFLLSKGRVEEANAALTVMASGRLTRKLQGPPTPYLTEADIPDVVGESVPLKSLLSSTSLKRTAAIGAASWMSFGGQITLLVLMPTILVSQGYSISDSLAFTMTMNFGSLLGACAAAYFAQRLGRRTTVIGAAVLGCAAAVAFALFAKGVALILILGAAFQFFALLLNSTLAAWSPEVYPTEVRALGTSIVNGIGNVSGAVMPLIAVPVFHAYGMSGVFLMLASMYVVLAISARFAPETYRLSLEQINRSQV
ncbi:MFS transporter [Streptomyces sp. NPDC056112]|uniref:MFS transporter n=1 Tax=unclassified Streptomyces TaxID=2593676 RepID=UPI001CD4398C|nr:MULTISPECIES: MFS transporter [unclassified Streptomyces]